MRQFTVALVLALAFAPAAMARGGADVSVSASAPGEVVIGEEATATVIVRNDGPAAANAVKLTDVLAGPYAFVSATSSRGSCALNGPVVRCSLGTLKKGKSVEVEVTLEALDGGDLRNVLSVRARRSDPRPTNNSASTRTSVPRSACTIVGTAGRDRLRGTPGTDVVCGLAGKDVLVGLDGNDTLFGGSGNDRLLGGSGDDLLRGEEGRDTVDFKGSPNAVHANLRRGVAAGDGDDVLGGVEVLRGSRRGDVLRGSARSNRIFGRGGADRLYGGGGADKLYGQTGTDRLEGGGGRDILSGGRGRDSCRGGRRIAC
jgi:uncharacterized repeat protein (TIGR01451 family)